MQRIFIYPSDLQILTGQTPTWCRIILNRIRDAYGKQRHQHITIREYCKYENVDYDEVITALGLKK